VSFNDLPLLVEIVSPTNSGVNNYLLVIRPQICCVHTAALIVVPQACVTLADRYMARK
jgi:hypothetical protein